jgi:DNA-binding CsgD family transcriptional regulator
MAGPGSGDEAVAAKEAAAATNRSDAAPEQVERFLADLATRKHTDSEEVVLEVEVDGARYTVLRHPLQRGGSEAPLSSREQEIARMIALGYTNKAIAAVLDISAWTVGTHLRRIYGKLGVHSRSAMVARLVEQGSLREVGRSPDWRRLWRSP